MKKTNKKAPTMKKYSRWTSHGHEYGYEIVEPTQETERVAMNIVYQLGDLLEASAEKKG